MKNCEHCDGGFAPATNHPQQRFCSSKCKDAAYKAANQVKVAAYNETYHKAYQAANADRIRARKMVLRPQDFRKAYDLNCRPFPATYDPAVGEWVRCKQTFLPAPDKSPEAHLAAALIVIDERLAEGELV